MSIDAWRLDASGTSSADAFLTADGALDVERLAAHVCAVGKAHLDPRLCHDLKSLLDRLGLDDRLACALLDCLLDKHEGRYAFGSYIAAPVFALIPPDLPDRSRLLVQLLVSDAALHDLTGGRGGRERPSEPLVAKRARHAARIVAAAGGRELSPSPDVPAAAARQFQSVRAEVSAELSRHGVDAAKTLTASMLPVDTYSDEYLFLRVLQSYEAVFLHMARNMVTAVALVQSGDLAGATARVRECSASLRGAAGLFRLLATMQVTSFQAFRQETEGASAIQSEAYKYFESTCARPTVERLTSPAFEQTPLTRAHLRSRAVTLLSALENHLIEQPGDRAVGPLVAAMRDLDDENSAWRVTHVGMAARFLADARGSGNTDGLSYLESVREHRLFPRLREVVV